MQLVPGYLDHGLSAHEATRLTAGTRDPNYGLPAAQIIRPYLVAGPRPRPACGRGHLGHSWHEGTRARSRGPCLVPGVRTTACLRTRSFGSVGARGARPGPRLRTRPSGRQLVPGCACQWTKSLGRQLVPGYPNHGSRPAAAAKDQVAQPTPDTRPAASDQVTQITAGTSVPTPTDLVTGPTVGVWAPASRLANGSGHVVRRWCQGPGHSAHSWYQGTDGYRPGCSAYSRPQTIRTAAYLRTRSSCAGLRCLRLQTGSLIPPQHHGFHHQKEPTVIVQSFGESACRYLRILTSLAGTV